MAERRRVRLSSDVDLCETLNWAAAGETGGNQQCALMGRGAARESRPLRQVLWFTNNAPPVMHPVSRPQSTELVDENLGVSRQVRVSIQLVSF